MGDRDSAVPSAAAQHSDPTFSCCFPLQAGLLCNKPQGYTQAPSESLTAASYGSSIGGVLKHGLSTGLSAPRPLS